MVYGTRLPGEFFNLSPVTSVPNPSDYVSRLRASVQHIRPVSLRLTQPHRKVVDGLSTATHVFLRHDTIRIPLQPPYDGPYQVLKRTDKHSHSPLKVVMILSQLITSSLHTSITIFHTSHHRLQLQPLHLEQPDLVDMFTSQTTSHHSCRNTLGGGGGGVM